MSPTRGRGWELLEIIPSINPTQPAGGGEITAKTNKVEHKKIKNN